MPGPHIVRPSRPHKLVYTADAMQLSSVDVDETSVYDSYPRSLMARVHRATGCLRNKL